ncbi:MAG: ABC transporter permease subunit [Planctomycetota bacterium]
MHRLNPGLLAKALRESWLATLLTALGLFTAEVFLAQVLPGVFKNLSEQILQVRIVREIVSALLGADVGAGLGSIALMSVAWVHPVILGLLWAYVLVQATRVPAGEIDRGTIDILLSLPITRFQAYVAPSLVWLAGGLVLAGAVLLGNIIGAWSLGSDYTGKVVNRIQVSANLFAMYVAVGGIVSFISATCSRRGQAMAIAFGVLSASFLVNFLAAFQKSFEWISFLSVLDYYRPLHVLSGSGRLSDIFVLLTVGGLCWILGAVVFQRRDLPTT